MLIISQQPNAWNVNSGIKWIFLSPLLFTWASWRRTLDKWLYTGQWNGLNFLKKEFSCLFFFFFLNLRARRFFLCLKCTCEASDISVFLVFFQGPCLALCVGTSCGRWSIIILTWKLIKGLISKLINLLRARLSSFKDTSKWWRAQRGNM